VKVLYSLFYRFSGHKNLRPFGKGAESGMKISGFAPFLYARFVQL
jgi:hypothetical protein